METETRHYHHTQHRNFLLFCMLILVSYCAQGNIYKEVDKNGKVYFSDTQTTDAKKHVLNNNTNNQVHFPQISTVVKNKIDEISYTLTINSPKNKQTIRNNNGNITVYGEITPKTSKKVSFELLLDGQPINKIQTSAIFHLTNIDRGAHTLQLKAFINHDSLLATSATNTFYLHRAITSSRPTPVPLK